MFGLPGLLCTISGNNQRSEPLEIFGPVGLRRFIRTSLELSRTMLGFSYIVHEMKVLPCQIPPDVQVTHTSISYVSVIISTGNRFMSGKYAQDWRAAVMIKHF